MDWMRTSVGVSVHWTTHTAAQDGSRATYAQAVEGFDAARFVRSLKQAGAQHCIFTLTHAEQYLALPCAPLEEILPGRTTVRDLIGEVAEGLTREGIRFISYYNHSCNGQDDPAWKAACGYAAGEKGNLDAFAGRIADIVRFIAGRYGKSLAGWWFDSGYSVDPTGPHNSVSCEMGGWRFPWDRLIAAAKSGHADCAVAINAGVGSRHLYAPGTDYYAGECTRLDEPFSPEAVPGLIDHRWVCADNPAWVFSRPEDGFSRPRFTDGELARFLQANRQAGRMTTFNLEIDRSGRVNPYSLEQLARVREARPSI